MGGINVLGSELREGPEVFIVAYCICVFFLLVGSGGHLVFKCCRSGCKAYKIVIIIHTVVHNIFS